MAFPGALAVGFFRPDPTTTSLFLCSDRRVKVLDFGIARTRRRGSRRWTRASFLENIPEHARTLELASAWIGDR